MTQTQPLLELKDVHSYYGNIHALKGISLTVDKGDPKNFVSFCWDGDVTKTGPTTFQAKATDFYPPWDRELEVLIGYAANGLYTVAFILLVIAGWRVLPKLALALSGPVAGSGIALALVSLRHDPRLQTITSAVLFLSLIAWMVVVARWLRSDASS